VRFMVIWQAVECCPGQAGGREASGVDVESLDRLLDRTRQALELSGSAAPPGNSAIQGEGSAANGLVGATVTSNHVESVRLHPHAMRRGSAELATEISAAINAGFVELRHSAGSEDVQREAQSRAAALSAKLRDVQNDSMRSMATIAQALDDAVSLFGRNHD
jgi:hypothetical protein